MCISLFFSCYEDKGNYSYGELETIKISNVESEYTKIYLDERLQIDPQVETSDPHADLKYKWTFLGDTIALSSQLALDTFMSWKPASYNLVLQVTNSNTGYTVYKQTKVTVNTEFSIGWYVLKDDGSVADLDLYTDTKLIPNVIQRVNGTPLQGRGEKISFFADHDVFDADNNKYSGKAILFCLTDKDINGIDAVTAHRWREFEDLFFEQPEKREPGCMAEGIVGAFMINNGKVYPLELSSASNGKFGTKRHLNGDYNNYYLSKYAYCDGFKYDLLVYDTVSCSFCTASARQDYMSVPKDGEASEMSGQNTNKELLYLGSRTFMMGTHAYAVLQDKSDPDLKMISKIKIIVRANFFISGLEFSNDTLEVNSPAWKAEGYTMSHSEEVMYFVADGKLYSQNVAGKKGQPTVEFEIPAGEKATFIKSQYLNKKNFLYNSNYVILGTEINGTYKIRCFGKTTAGHLNPVPELELPREGEVAEGRAADAIFIHTTLRGMTYIQSY